MPGPDDDVDDAIGSLEESAPPPEAENAIANGAAPAGPGRNPNSSGGRQRKSVGSTAGLGQGIAAAAKDDPRAPFPVDAMDAANEIARRITKFGLGSIDNLDAHIFPEDGSSPRRLAVIRFSELAGHPQLSPGAMLEKLVTARVHRPSQATTEKTYNVSFHWRKDGSWLTRNAKIYLGSVGEIDQLEAAANPQALPPYSPAPAYGQAPMGVGGYGAPPAYAPPPAPQAPQMSPENQAMWDRLQRTEGALSEVLDFLKSQRNAPAGLGAAATAPPAPASPHAAAAEGLAGIAEVVAQSVARTLVSMGVAKAPDAPQSPNAGAGAVAAAPPVPRDPLVTELETLVGGVLRTGMKAIGTQLQASMTQAFAGVGAPPPPAAPPGEAVEAPDPLEAEPAPEPPFYTTNTGATWQDGRPVIAAHNADGEMDWKAMVLTNPILMEHGMGFLSAIKDKISQVSLPGGTQVVGSTPKGAVDGTPRAQGMGSPPPQPPPSPNAPRETAPRQPPPAQTRNGGGFPGF